MRKFRSFDYSTSKAVLNLLVAIYLRLQIISALFNTGNCTPVSIKLHRKRGKDGRGRRSHLQAILSDCHGTISLWVADDRRRCRLLLSAEDEYGQSEFNTLRGS